MGAEDLSHPGMDALRGGQPSGWTLVELITVIAILGIASAMMLSAVHRTKSSAQIQKARVDINELVEAITEYEMQYGQCPISKEALEAASELKEDITFGGVIQETGTWIAGPSSYLTNNAEVMAVLLDLEHYGDGAPTINLGHARNPGRNRFLDPPMRGGTNALPGVGIDGIYRDPWGAPYAITLDLNLDGHARDFFYRNPTVSADPNDPTQGLNGLVSTRDSESNACFEVPSSVAVWSSGPDHRLSTFERADQGVNRDNLLSWKR